MLGCNSEYFWGYSRTNFLFYILRFCPCDNKNANLVSNTFKYNFMTQITSLTQYLKYPHLHFIDSEMSETCRPIVFSFHRVLSLFLHTYWPRSVYNNYHCTCMFYSGVGQNHPGQNPSGTKPPDIVVNSLYHNTVCMITRDETIRKYSMCNLFKYFPFYLQLCDRLHLDGQRISTRIQ